MMKSLIVLLGIFFVYHNRAQALDPDYCSYNVQRQGGIQVQRLWSESAGSCFFSVTPRNAAQELRYRYYLFTSEGLFMVFNSYGAGSDATTTAAREFYLFPRLNPGISFFWNEATAELEVTHVTGDTFYFDIKKGFLKRMTRAQLAIEPDILPSNRGGVEIRNYQSLLLDGGYAQGGSPTARPSGRSVFYHPSREKCEVKNSEIFKYDNDEDRKFRFEDEELGKFLERRC